MPVILLTICIIVDEMYGGHPGRQLGFFKILKGDRIAYSRF